MPAVVSSADPLVPPAPRSRRVVLAAGLGGLGAFLAAAFGRAPAARAAAGDALVVGQANNGSTSQTILLSTAGGSAFTLKDSASNGTGVFGWSSATGGIGRGLYGKSDSADGFGVQARNGGAAPGTGAALQAIGGNNTAIDATTAGPGVALKVANSAGGGSILATGTVNVQTGPTIGLIVASGGTAIQATSTLYGVNGHSPGSIGVNGTSSTGTGVNAVSTSGIAVRALSVQNWSGYFDIDARVENDFQVGGNQSVDGYLAVGGDLSVGGTKSFRIDHPADPENKYLLHYCAESSEPTNVYGAVVTLDAQGAAWVRLPDWYGLINADPRYQLTAIGEAAPGLHVRTEMRNGRFEIAGGAPGQRISWQVTARREDAHTRAHPSPVEVVKPARERGTYLRPDLHGHGPERGIPPLHALPTSPPPGA